MEDALVDDVIMLIFHFLDPFSRVLMGLTSKANQERRRKVKIYSAIPRAAKELLLPIRTDDLKRVSIDDLADLYGNVVTWKWCEATTTLSRIPSEWNLLRLRSVSRALCMHNFVVAAFLIEEKGLFVVSSTIERAIRECDYAVLSFAIAKTPVLITEKTSCDFWKSAEQAQWLRRRLPTNMEHFRWNDEAYMKQRNEFYSTIPQRGVARLGSDRASNPPPKIFYEPLPEDDAFVDHVLQHQEYH